METPAPAAARTEKPRENGTQPELADHLKHYQEFLRTEVAVQLKNPAAVMSATDSGSVTALPGPDNSPIASLVMYGTLEPTASGTGILMLYIDPRKRGREEPRIERPAIMAALFTDPDAQIELITRVYRPGKFPAAEE